MTDRAVATIKISEEQLQRQNKLKAPLDYARYVYPDLLKKVRADNVKITSLPSKQVGRAVRGPAHRRSTCRAGRG